MRWNVRYHETNGGTMITQPIVIASSATTGLTSMPDASRSSRFTL